MYLMMLSLQVIAPMYGYKPALMPTGRNSVTIIQMSRY
jgi:hypothetical protein